MNVDAGGQHVLERTAVIIDPQVKTVYDMYLQWIITLYAAISATDV